MNRPTSMPPSLEISVESALPPCRTESFGLLAARVAHDVNNLLTPMLMVSSVLRDGAHEAHHQRLLDTLDAAVGRATMLLRQILDYPGGVPGWTEPVSVRRIFFEIGTFSAETFPREILVEQSVPDDLWCVQGDPAQVHRLLLNLCVNARDSMPQGGRLRLQAENLVVTEAVAATIGGGRAGPFVLLQVADTGSGFPAEVLARLWQPQGTTKLSGQHSGLGLSTVRDIVAAHGGFIELHSRPGAGSVFRIYLPAAVPPPKGADADAPPVEL